MAISTVRVKGGFIQDEKLANAAITPGMLIEVMSTDKVRAHATAGGVAQAAFALRDVGQGKSISQAYSAGNPVGFGIGQKGSQVNALIANGEAIAIGDKLVSNGDGYLKEASGDSSGVVVEEYVVAIARAALDLSDSSGADPSSQRCVVEIL